MASTTAVRLIKRELLYCFWNLKAAHLMANGASSSHQDAALSSTESSADSIDQVLVRAAHGLSSRALQGVRGPCSNSGEALGLPGAGATSGQYPFC